MEELNYDQALQKAQIAAVELKKGLEKLILGKTLGPWSCNCGVFSHGIAKAVRIMPAGWTYEYQITDHFLWGVDMEDIDGSGKRYSIGLSSFLEKEQVDAIFKEAFNGINSKALEQEYFRREREKEEMKGINRVLGFKIKSDLKILLGGSK